MGRLELAVEAEFARGKLGGRVQLMRGEMALEPGERVTRVEARAVLSVAAVEGALVSTRLFVVGTGRGRRLTVTSVAHEERGEVHVAPTVVAEWTVVELRGSWPTNEEAEFACRLFWERRADGSN